MKFLDKVDKIQAHITRFFPYELTTFVYVGSL